ncbi:class I SAM-dependent methyltransferase [Pseudoramibacter faecis]|uniref:class I SAM-dependent methyltransferase n=1 Tax=Pseudoramibacter faecis TaxID=3108534 RepID=UPI002E778125|nr:methyltransferase domain-containing protein [Pseudoramibacter sp. HA2172]
MPNIIWDVTRYENKFSFVPRYGEALLDLITGGNGSFVVDIGCGDGMLTQQISDRGYRVLGIDDSDAMLKMAVKKHPDIAFHRGNAVDFHLREKADVLFSNAVFHWIDRSRQQTMLANLFSNLKPGGELVCEFGGYGCAENIHGQLEKAFLKRGLTYDRVFYFPTIGEYAPMLEKAGFKVEVALLFDRPTPQKGEHGLVDWIRMFDKKPFEGINEKTEASIIQEAERSLQAKLFRDGNWFVDYVRIRIRARKPL